ncbi:hypothetical protein [Bacillus sp. 1P06AnD]|uniref:hypothetical protein n=1 Tax=Bacillus sp. 1P06AnD TaxID=3132208 RepID=UPI0039A0A0F7
MNSFAVPNQYNQDHNAEGSPSLITRLLSNPMRIALWDEQSLTWEYPYGEEMKFDHSGLFSVKAMNSTKEHEIIRFQLSNESALKKKVKIMVQYHNIFEKGSTAFYSPQEKAIICFYEKHVTMLGGQLQGKGMSQYCIHDVNAYSENNWTECLQTGCLPLSWLAKGEICSTFILEAELAKGEKQEGIIWSFHSESEGIVRKLKNEMI